MCLRKITVLGNVRIDLEGGEQAGSTSEATVGKETR